ncbi:MAG: hypothetical protein EPN22_05450 [Nitrospirae bacterium]|nr:MAG: hypothetical protein EPN22_05450 [Nitrospirota bacterium]
MAGKKLKSFSTVYLRAMSAVIVLVFVICGFWTFTIKHGESLQAAISEESSLAVLMRERYINHLKWVMDLNRHIMTGEEFNRQLDHTLCDFGKWYYAYKPQQVELDAYRNIEDPHKKLHQAAKDIIAAGDAGTKAAILNDRLLPEIERIKTSIEKMTELKKTRMGSEIEKNRLFHKTVMVVLWAVPALAIIAGGVLYKTCAKNFLIQPLLDFSDKLRRMSEGDLSVDFTLSKAALETDMMAEAAGSMLKQLKDIISKINGLTEKLSSFSARLSEVVENQKKLEQELGMFQSVATASSDMSTTIVDVGKSAGYALQASHGTSEMAARGKDTVERSVASMLSIAETMRESAETINSLGQSSQEIGSIVSVIKDIAEQTNLLALNAAIEAARAGEQGRGFAVVADEVRKLAEKTSSATREITEKIKKIQEMSSKSVEAITTGTLKVDEGVNLSKAATDSLNEIVEASRDSIEKVQHITSTTEQHFAVASQIAFNIGNFSDIIDQAAETGVMIQKISENLSASAKELNSMVKWFRV